MCFFPVRDQSMFCWLVELPMSLRRYMPRCGAGPHEYHTAVPEFRVNGHT